MNNGNSFCTRNNKKKKTKQSAEIALSVKPIIKILSIFLQIQCQLNLIFNEGIRNDGQ